MDVGSLGVFSGLAPRAVLLVTLLGLASSAPAQVQSDRNRLVPRPTPAGWAQDQASEVMSGSGYSLDAAAADSQVVDDPQLIGYWECRGKNGTIEMEFLSEEHLIFAGRHVKYFLAKDTIRVKDDYGFTAYPYRVDGDRLFLTMNKVGSETSELTFRRVDLSPDTQSTR